jgi:CO dehydrogenase maturation factor
VRSILGEIVSESEDITVMDMEASIEHMSSGTVLHVYALLIVTEPYYRALETARRTVPLARGLGINNIFAVANKLRSAEDEQAVKDFCARHSLEIIATIPFDQTVTQADLLGKSLIDFNADSTVVSEITRLAASLRERALNNSSSAEKTLSRPNC